MIMINKTIKKASGLDSTLDNNLIWRGGIE